jgi:hypothetical protein
VSHEDNPEERAREATDHCKLAADKLHGWESGDAELESAARHVTLALRALADVLDGIDRVRRDEARDRAIESWGEDT